MIPSKIFEAMAMQRPIIMGVSGESREIVAASGSGIDIEPENEQQLVMAVQELADSPALAKRLRIAGRNFVAEHYTRNALAAEYFEIIRAVAARRPVPRGGA